MSSSSPSPSSIGDRDSPLVEPSGPTIKTGPRRRMSLRVASAARWLHIYLSMAGLFVLLFFSVTGVTLNHPEWFGVGPEHTSEAEGTLEPRWVKVLDSENPTRAVSKLEVVEHLRRAHGVRGALAGFTIDERECVVTFKGPGYSADAFIERGTGGYRLTQMSHGFLATINDLHKGRDTGPVWSAVIDLSAVLMILASLTGLVLLFSIKRRRLAGFVTALVGMALVMAVVYLLVP